MVMHFICSFAAGLILLLVNDDCLAMFPPQKMQNSDSVSKQEATKAAAQELNRNLKSMEAELKARLRKDLDALLKKKLRGKTIRPPLKETKFEFPELRKKYRSELMEKLELGWLTKNGDTNDNGKTKTNCQANKLVIFPLFGR